MILAKEKINIADSEEIFEEFISGRKTKEFLVLVPTNRKARDLKKEIITKSKGKVVTELNLETFETFCTKLLECSVIFTKLSEAAASILLSRAISECELKYFSSYKDELPKGTLDRIKNVISEYKRQGLSPELLKEEYADNSHAEQIKAEDIAAIYKKYGESTKNLKAYETGDIYSELLNLTKEELENNFNTNYNNVKQIIIKGFDEFSELELRIITSLADLPGRRLIIQLDFNESNPVLFSHPQRCYNKLLNKGFITVSETEIGKEDNFRAVIRKKLFSETKSAPITKLKNNLLKIPAYNRNDEVINIAKEIKKLIVDEKVNPNDICVVFNVVQNYSQVVSEVFSTYGLPVNLTDRVYLEYTSPIIAILNLLEISENDYYFKNVIRAFSNNIILKEGIDIKSIVKAAVDLKIIGGKDNWIKTVKNAIDEIEKYPEDAEISAGKIDTYKSVLSSINNIRKILEPFEAPLTINDFYEKLERTIYNLAIPFNVLAQSTEKEKEVKAITTFLETLKEVFNLLILQYGENKTFPLSFFLEQAVSSARHSRFNVKEKSDSAVLVTTPEEIRGLEFDYLFIGGLCDGDLPAKYYPDNFFSGTFVKNEELFLAEERFLFYQSLCTWKKRLYLSYPNNETGKELNESSFLKELTFLFKMTIIDSNYFSGKIYSPEEIQKILGGAEGSAKENILVPELEKHNFNYEDYTNSVSVQNARLNPEITDSPYKGYINKKALPDKKELGDKFENQFEILKNKQYSITQLETYAKCPFKFFIERALKITTEEEPSEEVEAIELGNLLHSIFFEFFTYIRDRNVILKKCSDIDFLTAQKKLFEIGNAKLDSMQFLSPLNFYEKEKILGINGDETKSILFKLLTIERKTEDDYVPKYFELPFGMVDKENSDASIKENPYIKINGVKLKGKVDRIEINKSANTFRVVDYKLSGKKPSINDLLEGLSLQLPVYLCAVEQILYNNYNEKLIPAEMVIYSLKYKVKEFGKERIKLASKKSEDEDELTAKLLESVKEYIAGYVNSISNGVFNLSKLPNREDAVCCYCGLKAICRVSDEL